MGRNDHANASVTTGLAESGALSVGPGEWSLA